MEHGDAREEKWRWNWRMEWVASTFHTTSEHGVSSITTADPHISAASSRLNWRPWWFKWTRQFPRKTKSGFCACAITFQTQSTNFSYRFSTPSNTNMTDTQAYKARRTLATITIKRLHDFCCHSQTGLLTTNIFVRCHGKNLEYSWPVAYLKKKRGRTILVDNYFKTTDCSHLITAT